MPTAPEMTALVHKMYRYWNDGEMEAFYDMLDEHVKDHNAGEGETGRAGVRAALDTIRGAFPDHRYTVERVVADAEQNMVAAHLTCTGTQEGDFFGVAPSGKPATWKEIRIAVWNEAGRCTDHWAVGDTMGMLLQLGHLKWPGRASW